MKRSVRRYQQAVANARRVRILLRHGVWSPSLGCVPKAWRSLSRLVMNEPGWWVHDLVELYGFVPPINVPVPAAGGG